jgi:hypothetical protein
MSGTTEESAFNKTGISHRKKPCKNELKQNVKYFVLMEPGHLRASGLAMERKTVAWRNNMGLNKVT